MATVPSMPSITFLDLPVEVLTIVFEHARRKDLQNIALVSRKIYNAVSHILYRELRIGFTKGQVVPRWLKYKGPDALTQYLNMHDDNYLSVAGSLNSKILSAITRSSPAVLGLVRVFRIGIITVIPAQFCKPYVCQRPFNKLYQNDDKAIQGLFWGNLRNNLRKVEFGCNISVSTLIDILETQKHLQLLKIGGVINTRVIYDVKYLRTNAEYWSRNIRTLAIENICEDALPVIVRLLKRCCDTLVDLKLGFAAYCNSHDTDYMNLITDSNVAGNSASYPRQENTDEAGGAFRDFMKELPETNDGKLEFKALRKLHLTNICYIGEIMRSFPGIVVNWGDLEHLTLENCGYLDVFVQILEEIGRNRLLSLRSFALIANIYLIEYSVPDLKTLIQRIRRLESLELYHTFYNFHRPWYTVAKRHSSSLKTLSIQNCSHEGMCSLPGHGTGSYAPMEFTSSEWPLLEELNMHVCDMTKYESEYITRLTDTEREIRKDWMYEPKGPIPNLVKRRFEYLMKQRTEKGEVKLEFPNLKILHLSNITNLGEIIRSFPEIAVDWETLGALTLEKSENAGEFFEILLNDEKEAKLSLTSLAIVKSGRWIDPLDYDNVFKRIGSLESLVLYLAPRTHWYNAFERCDKSLLRRLYIDQSTFDAGCGRYHKQSFFDRVHFSANYFNSEEWPQLEELGIHVCDIVKQLISILVHTLRYLRITPDIYHSSDVEIQESIVQSYATSLCQRSLEYYDDLPKLKKRKDILRFPVFLLVDFKRDENTGIGIVSVKSSNMEELVELGYGSYLKHP
ncbi:hypothetical protein H072_10126 [Dactylellina haptotyla CBS 200.50]|uniref:F-box domain-containing protein n=1 Tax=Dactylellina haptotyla (strain CBS 200.50) TaxID=1284197 RepID=S8BME7_DACHA|nr:hypothetical protein H072_10126 [Dactylellina haptotyla CBS 200.50]